MLLKTTNTPSQSYPDGLYGRIRSKHTAALVHILSRKDERERLKRSGGLMNKDINLPKRALTKSASI